MIAAKIIKAPRKINHLIQKGAIILSSVDEVCRLIPNLKTYFFLIERRGWVGMNDSQYADIKLVEDLTTWEETKQAFPQAVLLDIGPADFINTHNFRPLSKKVRTYAGIQVARWEKFKRHSLLVEAAALRPDKRILVMGHFSTDEEPAAVVLRNDIMEMAQRKNADISFPYSKVTNSKKMPLRPKTINKLINTARMGILTTTVEGINRFKMECLAADIPVLVPSDCSAPTKKHINPLTGVQFEPTPRGLAEAIDYVEENYGNFTPRTYLLQHTGIVRSLEKLRTALRSMAAAEKEAQNFDDIFWDGRNESLRWRDQALVDIRECIARVEKSARSRSFWKFW